MRTVWRLIKTKHAHEAFSGEGSKDAGGRWNRKGIPVVYTSESMALAVLECFARLGLSGISMLDMDFSYIKVGIPKEVKIDELDLARLPSDWKQFPEPQSTQNIGTLWYFDKKSAVLKVPSVIVSMESNYIINPFHKDFKKLVINDPSPYSYDFRLVNIIEASLPKNKS